MCGTGPPYWTSPRAQSVSNPLISDAMLAAVGVGRQDHARALAAFCVSSACPSACQYPVYAATTCCCGLGGGGPVSATGTAAPGRDLCGRATGAGPPQPGDGQRQACTRQQDREHAKAPRADRIGPPLAGRAERAE